MSCNPESGGRRRLAWRMAPVFAIAILSLVTSGCPDEKKQPPKKQKRSADKQSESSTDSPTAEGKPNQKTEREQPTVLEREQAGETESGSQPEPR